MLLFTILAFVGAHVLGGQIAEGVPGRSAGVDARCDAVTRSARRE
jgi:hypothetical protein